MPLGLTAFKDINIISVCLSYSASTVLSLPTNLTLPSSVCSKAPVDNMSSLTITPVSFNPIFANLCLNSCANLFILPFSTASAKSIVLFDSSTGGSCWDSLLFCSCSNCAIASEDNLPSVTSLLTNSSVVSLKASALLSIFSWKLLRKFCQ